jgi:hypothetical protein
MTKAGFKINKLIPALIRNQFSLILGDKVGTVIHSLRAHIYGKILGTIIFIFNNTAPVGRPSAEHLTKTGYTS